MTKKYSSGKNHYKFKNIDGQIFGKLVVLDSLTKNKKVLVKCECGKTFETNKGDLNNGRTKSCGEGSCRGTRSNLIGQKFGKLTVISFITGSKRWWLCECECGNTTKSTPFALRTGKHKSCSCYNKAQRPNKRLENNASPKKRIYKNYFKAAKKRNYIFTLTIKEFSELINKNCVYCGSEPNMTLKIRGVVRDDFKFNGVDRVDNKIGYTIENCVSCCKICNNSKASLSLEDWKTWLVKIYSNIFANSNIQNV